jgi:hypothetical protein
LPWGSTPSTSPRPRWQRHVGLYSCTISTATLLFFYLVFPAFNSYALSPVMAMIITFSCGGSSEVSPTCEAVRHCPDRLTRRQLLHVSYFVSKYLSITEQCVCVALMLHNWFFLSYTTQLCFLDFMHVFATATGVQMKKTMAQLMNIS